MTERFRPIIVIGAARSGTKLIRDLLAEHPLVNKVPYDVNYIWRLGNESVGHDELSPKTLGTKEKARIRRKLGKFSKGAPYLIEKTVSNCLRVGFVECVFPQALYIHLIRHGEDVIESAYRQWLSSPEWKYIFQKAKTFPVFQAFSYGASYAINTIQTTIMRGKGKVGTWGPRYAGIDEDVAAKALIEVCAIQWSRCVQMAVEGLGRLSESRVHEVRYEEFVEHPLKQLRKIASFFGIDPEPYADEAVMKKITQRNVGKGVAMLSREERALILPHIKESMHMLGYDVARVP